MAGLVCTQALSASLKEPCPEVFNGRQSIAPPEGKESVVNSLPESEQSVYQRLGEIYQKIYLYALNDEERHRVVVYIRRGLNPYEAINTILRSEERRYNARQPRQSLSPAERSRPSHKSPTILMN
tara:strand:- start:66 stop:440 length:375 start_codon:yes stop_codon:yes gene_type:complete